VTRELVFENVHVSGDIGHSDSVAASEMLVTLALPASKSALTAAVVSRLSVPGSSIVLSGRSTARRRAALGMAQCSRKARATSRMYCWSWLESPPKPP
jgi:hypothetical protein